jgi:hypothetical protein
MRQFFDATGQAVLGPTEFEAHDMDFMTLEDTPLQYFSISTTNDKNLSVMITTRICVMLAPSIVAHWNTC